MAYDEMLATRISGLLATRPGFSEKKMFGGVGYLFYGNMACGVNGENLIVRVGPENYQSALSDPDTDVFDMTGRPMTGWVVVKPSGTGADENLIEWVERGVMFALSLPPK